MIAELALVITMTLTAYAPACRGINGNPNRVRVEDSLKTVACGRKWKIGQQFLIKGFEEYGINLVTCNSRGGSVGPNNLDLLVLTGKTWEACKADYAFATRIIGRKRMVVEVITK